MKGRYNKAILNCNEAIEVQSNSLRAYLYRLVTWKMISKLNCMKWLRLLITPNVFTV